MARALCPVRLQILNNNTTVFTNCQVVLQKKIKKLQKTDKTEVLLVREVRGKNS
jgi:hypothetical protein